MGRLLSHALIATMVLGTACGDDMPPPAPPPPHSDGGADGAMDSSLGDAMAMACNEDPLGPTVEITAPAPATDPNTDEVLTASTVMVVCTATQSTMRGSLPVDSTSVAIEVLGSDGAVVATPMVELGATDSYEAMVDLTDVENGPVTIRCTARDNGAAARCKSAEVSTFVDHGPTITVVSPPEDVVVASRLQIRYQLSAAPLDATDTEADIAGHELVVAGRTITTMTEESPGEYLADLDLEDRTIFPDPLDGPRSFSIRAWNDRTPEAGERLVTQAFTVDAVGPTIMITNPMEAGLVGGLTLVEAQITDAGGVDPATVMLRVGGMMFPMTASGDTYSRTFDASGFARTIAELTINVSASDVAGNMSVASLNAKLDSTPPYISLDPPLIREARISSGVMQCSALFDPVGDDSVDDGEVVGTAAEFRVRTEDLPNSSFGGTGTAAFLAGLDATTVDVYILDNTSVPLLVDLDSDGICDDINPAVLPGAGGTDTAVVLELEGVGARGAAYFDPSLDFTGAPAPFDSCVAGSSAVPSPLCVATSPVTRIIPAVVHPTDRTIFGKPPIAAMTCVGDAWDFQTNISEGWACVAARAEDNLGNVGVSPPVRACFINGVAPEPCPASLGTIVDASMRPSCTDGCTPPPSFDSIPGLQLVCPSCP